MSWWEREIVQLLWRAAWQFLKTVKIEPYDLAIPLLGMAQRNENRGLNRFLDTVFIAGFIMIAARRDLPGAISRWTAKPNVVLHIQRNITLKDAEDPATRCSVDEPTFAK